MQRRATNASDTAKERDFDYMAVCILVLYRKNIFLCLLPSLCVVSHDPLRVRDLGLLLILKIVIISLHSPIIVKDLNVCLIIWN